MRGQCAVENCSMPEETRKIHEDFEMLTYNICWECGNAIKEKLGNKAFARFEFVIQAIEKELS